jgi:hypothetical protein
MWARNQCKAGIAIAKRQPTNQITLITNYLKYWARSPSIATSSIIHSYKITKIEPIKQVLSNESSIRSNGWYQRCT